MFNTKLQIVQVETSRRVESRAYQLYVSILLANTTDVSYKTSRESQ